MNNVSTQDCETREYITIVEKYNETKEKNKENIVSDEKVRILINDIWRYKSYVSDALFCQEDIDKNKSINDDYKALLNIMNSLEKMEKKLLYRIGTVNQCITEKLPLMNLKNNK